MKDADLTSKPQSTKDKDGKEVAVTGVYSADIGKVVTN